MARPLNKFLHPIKRSKSVVGESELSFLYSDHNFECPIIFLHGIPASAELWREVMVLLTKDNFGVYAPDLAGYGLTRLPSNGDYSLNGSAALIAQWIQANFEKPVWIVGHDIGGAIAQILALNYPETVSRLTLCNAPIDASWPVLPVRIFKIIAHLGLFPTIAKAGLVPNPYTTSKMRNAFFDSRIISKEKIKRIFWSGKLYDEEGRHQFVRHLKALNNTQTRVLKNRYKELAIPVQLLWAANDYYQPWQTTGKQLEKAIPETSTFIIDETGHYMPIEKPDLVARALLDWHDSL